MQYPDARLTLFIEIYFTKQLGMDNTAMHTLLTHISNLQAGKPAVTFGYAMVKDRFVLTAASKEAPKVHLALQFLIKNFFRISNTIAVRLGKGTAKVPSCKYADGSALIHYVNDVNPDFHYYETA